MITACSEKQKCSNITALFRKHSIKGPGSNLGLFCCVIPDIIAAYFGSKNMFEAKHNCVSFREGEIKLPH